MANPMDIPCHYLERFNLDRENRALVELKKKKKKMDDEEEERKILSQGQSVWETILDQEQERAVQIQLSRNALAENHLLQIKEKSLRKDQEKQDSKEELQMLVHLDELHAQELRWEEAQTSLLKKMKHKDRLEEISRVNSYREEQAEIVLKEEEQTMLAHMDLEEKLLRRKADIADTFTRQRMTSQNVIDKLVSLKKEQAAATAKREAQSLIGCLAKIQAEKVKLQKEAEKRAEAIRSISAHRLKMIQERQQREEAERQSNMNYLKSQQDADNTFLEANKSEAEKLKKEKLQLQDFNNRIEAEKRQSQFQQNLLRLEYGTARHTLGGRVDLSCGEGSSYTAADVSCAPLINFGRAVKKPDCKRLREITLANTDSDPLLIKNKAVDANDTNKELEQVKVLTQGHKDTVQPRPTPPPAELRNDSQKSIRVKKLINRPEAVPVNPTLEKKPLDRENQVKAELRITKQKMADAEERRKTAKVVLSTCDKVLSNDKRRGLQYQINRKAMAEKHLQQIKERAAQKAQEKRQNKKDLEKRREMDKLHAQELKWQEGQKPLLKRIERKKYLEDITTVNAYRKEQAQILSVQKEQTKLAEVELEMKLLQRKADAILKVTRQRLPSKIVCDKLATLKKEQAAATADGDECSTFTGLARRRALQELQRKEKAGRNAKTLQSIYAHKHKMVKERERREEAERQGSVDKLRAKKDGDRSHLEEIKLKAQRARKEKVQLQNLNNFQEAEKRQNKQTQTSEDPEAEGHTLDRGVRLICDEAAGDVATDTAATQSSHYGRANGTQGAQRGQEPKREVMNTIGQINQVTFSEYTLSKLPSIRNR